MQQESKPQQQVKERFKNLIQLMKDISPQGNILSQYNPSVKNHQDVITDFDFDSEKNGKSYDLQIFSITNYSYQLLSCVQKLQNYGFVELLKFSSENVVEIVKNNQKQLLLTNLQFRKFKTSLQQCSDIEKKLQKQAISHTDQKKLVQASTKIFKQQIKKFLSIKYGEQKIDRTQINYEWMNKQYQQIQRKYSKQILDFNYAKNYLINLLIELNIEKIKSKKGSNKRQCEECKESLLDEVKKTDEAFQEIELWRVKQQMEKLDGFDVAVFEGIIKQYDSKQLMRNNHNFPFFLYSIRTEFYRSYKRCFRQNGFMKIATFLIAIIRKKTVQEIEAKIKSIYSFINNYENNFIQVRKKFYLQVLQCQVQNKDIKLNKNDYIQKAALEINNLKFFLLLWLSQYFFPQKLELQSDLILKEIQNINEIAQNIKSYRIKKNEKTLFLTSPLYPLQMQKQIQKIMQKREKYVTKNYKLTTESCNRYGDLHQIDPNSMKTSLHYNSIVQIVNSLQAVPGQSIGQGTGFIIGKKIILTAAHLVKHFQDQKVAEKYLKIKIYGSDHLLAVRKVKFNKNYGSLQGSSNQSSLDYALIFLKEDIPTWNGQERNIKLLYNFKQTTFSQTVGYLRKSEVDQGKVNKQMVNQLLEQEKRVLYKGDGHMIVDSKFERIQEEYSTLDGMSGAPIMVKDLFDNDTVYAVGIHCASSKNAQTLNVGVLLTQKIVFQFNDWIENQQKSWLAQDKIRNFEKSLYLEAEKQEQIFQFFSSQNKVDFEKFISHIFLQMLYIFKYSLYVEDNEDQFSFKNINMQYSSQRNIFLLSQLPLNSTISTGIKEIYLLPEVQFEAEKYKQLIIQELNQKRQKLFNYFKVFFERNRKFSQKLFKAKIKDNAQFTSISSNGVQKILQLINRIIKFQEQQIDPSRFNQTFFRTDNQKQKVFEFDSKLLQRFDLFFSFLESTADVLTVNVVYHYLFKRFSKKDFSQQINSIKYMDKVIAQKSQMIKELKINFFNKNREFKMNMDHIKMDKLNEVEKEQFGLKAKQIEQQFKELLGQVNDRNILENMANLVDFHEDDEEELSRINVGNNLVVTQFQIMRYSYINDLLKQKSNLESHSKLIQSCDHLFLAIKKLITSKQQSQIENLADLTLSDIKSMLDLKKLKNIRQLFILNGDQVQKSNKELNDQLIIVRTNKEAANNVHQALSQSDKQLQKQEHTTKIKNINLRGLQFFNQISKLSKQYQTILQKIKACSDKILSLESPKEFEVEFN